MLKLAVGADHAGFSIKEGIIAYAKKHGYQVLDLGTHATDRVDYPDYGHAVAKAVEQKEADFGILICGSGNGICMAANRHAGIRAALAWMPEVAALARQHNNANIICLPARFINQDQAQEIVHAFLKSDFEGGRHTDRILKI